jgi:hypothetical protein
MPDRLGAGCKHRCDVAARVGERVRAIPARGVRAKRPRGVFVQGPWVLPLVRRTAHGRARRAPGRRRASVRGRTSVGADVSSRIRYLLAWDHALCRSVVALSLRAVLAFLRARARRRGVTCARGGAVAIIQRFGAAHCWRGITSCVDRSSRSPCGRCWVGCGTARGGVASPMGAVAPSRSSG